MVVEDPGNSFNYAVGELKKLKESMDAGQLTEEDLSKGMLYYSKLLGVTVVSLRAALK